MTTETFDPIALFAKLNPIPAERVDDLAHSSERETTFARIVARRNGAPGRARPMPRRRIVAALVVALALAVPAVAFSGALGSLFGFSNEGTPVSPEDLSRVSAVLGLTGARPGSVVKLASRDGWKFYGARTSSGDVCYFDEPPGRSDSDGIPNAGPGGACKNAAGEADFPSPSRPVFNMSHYLGAPPDMSIITLAGVAADGVASLQVLALSDCHVVATTPVMNNVYLADNLPMIPEAEIVARDVHGNVVWHQAVDAAIEPAPNETTCGLG